MAAAGGEALSAVTFPERPDVTETGDGTQSGQPGLAGAPETRSGPA
jgi:hypothetical protein